jgi:Ca2+-binding RTX toxin-like protein
MRTRSFVLTALLALTLPAAAAASTASVSSGTLTVGAGAGEQNDLGIEQRPDGYVVQDNYGPVVPSAGCTEVIAPYGHKSALCTGVTAIEVGLGDRDDTLRPIGPLAAPLTYSGGAGTDLIIYLQTSAAIALSSDGFANDGPSGKDNVGPDVERLFGTRFPDTLATGARGGELIAGSGDDTLTGGAGNDTIAAAYVEDVGIESGTFYAQGKDTVTCGGGEDFVLSDSADVVAKDCEVVAVDNFGSHSNGGFLVKGSPHADAIGPLPYGWGPATVLAHDGNDTIRTSDVHRAYGGNGNDRIIGFDQAAQVFYGDAGNDRIDVRDKRAAKFNRDVVHCGSGRDLVYANGNDKVARDCERVKRR